MITVEIGDNQRNFTNSRHIDETWINEQINSRRTDGRTLCVRVKTDEGSLNITFVTADCGGAEADD